LANSATLVKLNKLELSRVSNELEFAFENKVLRFLDILGKQTNKQTKNKQTNKQEAVVEQQ